MTQPRPSRPTARLAQAGLGLIESLVALLVMCMGALAALSLQHTLNQQAQSARMHALALHLALIRVDRLESLPAAEGLSALAPPRWLTPAETQAESASSALYNLSHDIHDDEGLPSGFRRVSVRVDWTDAHGTAQSLQLHRLLQTPDPSLLLLAAYPPEPEP